MIATVKLKNVERGFLIIAKLLFGCTTQFNLTQSHACPLMHSDLYSIVLQHQHHNAI